MGMEDGGMDEEVVLASGSPRRRELLGVLGVRFVVDAPEVDEHTGLGAKGAVQELARRKGLAAAKKHPGQIVLAADTLVALEDRPLGKPRDEQEAFHMLKALSGRWHQVYTGVCVIDREGGVHGGVDESCVRFAEMDDAAIRSYIATGEPMDKAGAYALQGRAGMYIEEVRGTPSGVIGLPLPLVRKLLLDCGLPL